MRSGNRCSLLVPDSGSVDFYVRVRAEIERVRAVLRNFEKRDDVPLLSKDSLFNEVSGLRVVTW